MKKSGLKAVPGDEQIELPKLHRGFARVGLEVTPAMYRNMVRGSKKMFGRSDLAAFTRAAIKKTIYEILTLEEREPD